MEHEEIKPSFSLKYLVLTFVTTIVISGVGIGISKLYDSKPKNEFTVIDGFEIDLLNDEALPTKQFEAKFYLKGNPKIEISSLFRKSVTIKNSGNEGAENLQISAALKGANVFLVSEPNIKTEPKEIIDAITIKKDKGSTETQHDWKVSLLNPDESITFDYSIYSEADVDKIALNIIPRKKDWVVVRQSAQSLTYYGFKKDLAIASLTPPLLLLFIILFSLIIYRIQWRKRADFREQYTNFFHFWMRHRPWNLF